MTVPRWLLDAFRGQGRPLALAIGVLLLGNAASAGAAWCLGAALDAGSGALAEPGGGSGAVGGWAAGPWGFGGLYLGAVALSAAATWWARVAIERVAQAAMVAVRRTLFGHLLRHDTALHEEEGPGRLVSRVGGDVEAMRTLLSEAILQAPGDVLMAALLVGVLALSAPPLAGVMLASFPLYLLLLGWYRRVAPARMVASREIAAELTSFYAETLRALPVLRVYGRQGWAAERGRALAARKEGVDVGAGMTGVHFFNLLFGVRSLVLAGMVWAGGVLVARGELTMGVLLVGLDYARKAIEPFLRLQFHLTTLERARAGAARVEALLARVPRIAEPSAPEPWAGPDLEVAGVSLAYTPGSLVLRDVHLRAPPGRRVALVGPTGGGKSSLVALLLRFRDPDAGHVRYGGVDVRRLDLGELRRRVGYVAQGVHLLPGTVAENLGVSEAEAGELLRRVGLDARLRPGDLVGPGGEQLSRGESQLLCFARALAGDPEVLVLDEATSAMDPDTEARVSALVADLVSARGGTVVTVAHRLRLIADYDEICVVAEGRIVESGRHDALLARDGLYARLWRAQRARGG